MCKQAKDYLEDMKKVKEAEVESFGDLATSEGKNCPNCGNYMEKNMGCNHMSCICGHQFCWLCLKDFYSYHTAATGYYCSAPVVETTKYDASAFINTKSSRLIKSALFDIMNQHRKNRSNFAKKQKINKNMEEMVLFVLNKLFRFLKLNDLDFEKGNGYIKNLGLKTELDRNEGLFEFKKRIEGELVDLFQDVKSNYYQLNSIVEYLALLLSNCSNAYKTSNYSFKSNLAKSLKKGTIIVKIMDSIFEEEKSVNNLKRLIHYNKQIVKFVLNIRHLTVDYLNIYKHSKELMVPNQELKQTEEIN